MHGEKQMYYMFACCRLQPGGEWLTEISTVHNYKCSTAKQLLNGLLSECLGKEVKHPHNSAANMLYIYARIWNNICTTPPHLNSCRLLPKFHLLKSVLRALVFCRAVKEKQGLKFP